MPKLNHDVLQLNLSKQFQSITISVGKSKEIIKTMPVANNMTIAHF